MIEEQLAILKQARGGGPLGQALTELAARWQPSTVETPAQSPELPADLFDCVIGYDDLKDEIRYTLREGRTNHYLLIGPPATAKSLFLMELARLPGIYQATGSRVTAAGLTDAFLNYQPSLLILDEADKIPMAATAVLLSLMETGDLFVTKFRTHRHVKCEVAVFAAGNTDKKIPPELLSRFDTKLYFKPYSYQDFAKVCVGYLTRYEATPENLAAYIAEQTWNLLDKDVRTARGIARRIRQPMAWEVDRVVEFLRRYRKQLS